MLAVFPELLFLSPFAALLIRVSLFAVFAYSAYHRVLNPQAFFKTLGIIDALIALMLLTGVYAQPAAIVSALCTATWILIPSIRPISQSASALALIMSLSLIIMGAGPFAFDLPL